MSVLIRGARVVSPDPKQTRGGGRLIVRNSCDVLVEGSAIASLSPSGAGTPKGASQEIDARGRVLMPGFVDCHTHACFAGSRIDEWQMKLAGRTYLDILASGGGIMSTVRAVRAASEDQLALDLQGRLQQMILLGTTTVEVKSGYGLTTDDELKMLRAMRRASAQFPGGVFATALLGHAIDPARERAEFVREVLGITLPAVAHQFPGITIDAFVEQGAWTLEEASALFGAARALGLPCRVHADQFTSMGMVRVAIDHGFVSVDHLEASTPDDLGALARSETFAVMLPCSGFHLDGRYGSGRAHLDAGGRLAIATNCNPGSAPTLSMPMAVALAVRGCGLTPAEAIVSATRRGAELLGLTDRGAIEPGMIADLILLNHTDERSLAHEFGGNPVDMVMVGGRIVAPRS